MRYTTNETVLLTYEAKRLTTGLTDVKVTIWKDLTKEVDEATLTERERGMYYYEYIPTEDGDYTWLIDSASQPKRCKGDFKVGQAPDVKTHIELS
jgi:hypothetical protein